MSTAHPSHDDRTGDLDAISALAEPNRRSLYDYVVAQRDWVGREQAAQAVGLRRGIAAHHLDRLADDGLLDTEFHNLNGRRGPGAGRPAKVYRRAAADLEVSLPPRHYDLAGKVLSEAADRARFDGTPIDREIARAATREGREIGERGRARLEGRSGRDTAAPKRAEALFDELRTWGFEPETRDDGVTVLHNCPFHQLSRTHTELICTMNLCLLEAAVDAIEDAELRPALEPEEGYCCVRFHPSGGV